MHGTPPGRRRAHRRAGLVTLGERRRFKSSSKPPQTDPQQIAAAQAQANRDAVVASAQYNQINEKTPFGDLTYSGELGTPGRTRCSGEISCQRSPIFLFP